MTPALTACKEGRLRIASVATASPPYVASQDEAERFLTANYGTALSTEGLNELKRILSHRSVRKRHFAFDSPECLVDEDRDERIRRFTRWSTDLSEEACRRALLDAGAEPGDVRAIAVNTCTGYVCPGISNYLVERLGLSSGIRAYDLVGAGCGGAIPAMEIAGSALDVDDRNGVALVVSAEICSATFQMSNELSLMVSNAIFADGAGAAVLKRSDEGLEIMHTASHHLPEHREAVRFIHRGGDLHNQLEPSLPKMVGRALGEFIPDFLVRQRLALEDVSRWIVHPGGAKVLMRVARALHLHDNELAPSREVLAEFGNMSSATVWFILRKVMDGGLEEGELLLMTAFGAGMSLHACLLRA